MQGKAALDYHKSGRGWEEREEEKEEEEEKKEEEEGLAALIHAWRSNFNAAA